MKLNYTSLLKIKIIKFIFYFCIIVCKPKNRKACKIGIFFWKILLGLWLKKSEKKNLQV